jgi:hypothetical protein
MLRTGLKMRSGAYASSRQGTDYTGGGWGVGRSSWRRSIIRDKAGLTRMCVEAVLKASPILLTPLAVKTSFVGFNVVEAGFEEP